MEKTYKNKLQCGLNAMKYQLEEEKHKLKKINSNKIKALKRSYKEQSVSERREAGSCEADTTKNK